MATIYKYELSPRKKFNQLPQGAKVLSVGCQNDSLFLWAEVEPDNPLENRYFEVYGTGHPIVETEGKTRKFIGTAQMHGGALIWHIFEKVAQYSDQAGE